MNEDVRIRAWVVVGLLFVLHFLLHVGLSIGAGAPDLLTVALLIGAREVGLGPAALLGLVFGLLEDALSAVSFGANSIAMTVVALGGGVTRDLFVGDSRLFVVSYFFLGKVARDLLHWLSVGEGVRQPFVEQVAVQGTIGGAYAAVVGLALVTVTGLTREST